MYIPVLRPVINGGGFGPTGITIGVQVAKAGARWP